jgi:sugar phosphate isomerase/epimerase
MAFPQTLTGEGPIIQTLKQILTDPFFGAVEVSWVKDPQTRATVAQLLERAHLDIIFCGGPPILIDKLNLNAADAKVRGKAITECQRLIRQADGFGAKIFILCSGPDPGELARDEAREWLIDSITQLCDYAEKTAPHLCLSLEYFDRDVDKKLFIGPSREAAEIAQVVSESHANFGLTVDLSHLPLLGETAADALNLVKAHLIHVHIGNCVLERENPAFGDTHPRFGIPGGQVDVEELAEFLQELDKIGYFEREVPTSRPVVSFEVKPMSDETSELVIVNAKRALKDALTCLKR